MLQKLAGRTTHFFDQPEISVACSELAVPMALRADRDDFYWVALFNMAVSFLHLGETQEANERLNLLLPLLESSTVDTDQGGSSCACLRVGLEAQVTQ